MSDTEIPIGKQLAAQLLQQGKPEEARAVLERHCADHAQDAEAWFNLGMANVQLDRADTATACFRTAAALAPTKAVIHYNLGKTLQMTGRPAEAEASYREAIRLNPRQEAFHTNLGIVLLDQDRAEEAVRCFNQALVTAPRLPETHYNLGNALRRLGRFAEAEAAYRRTLEIKPDLAEAHESLGSLLLTLGRYNEAVNSYQAALDLRPDLLLARCGLAAALKEQGLGFKAEACYREVLEMYPGCAQAYLGLGRLFSENGLFEEAVESYQRVLEVEPNHPSAKAELAVVLERMGKIQEAWEIVQPLLQWEGGDKVAVALAFSDVGRHVGRQADALRMVEELLAETGGRRISDRQRSLLHFAAGHSLDRCGEYDRAFEHFRLGNEFYSRSMEFDCNVMIDTVSRHISTFNPTLMRRVPRGRSGSRRPVFIVGMPRSGTSLVEQILASHPQVHGAGELEDITWMAISLPEIAGVSQPYPECVGDLTQEVCDDLAGQYLNRLDALAPETALRVTDKMPGNYFHLGLIAVLFPGARIIHCVRDPLDTCLSCFFQSFVQANNHQYSYDLTNLGRAYHQYQRLMTHWKSVLEIPILEVSYEGLVAEQEKVTRELLTFCDLPWDDSCLRFYESKRQVVTASYDQVRRPLYASSIGRWRHYEPHLKPLREALSSG